jgi:osmoprotectant transport system permease protein
LIADFIAHLGTHVALSVSALLAALLVGIPVAAAIAERNRLRSVTLGAINVLRVIPSLAVLVLALPLLGVGFRPALLALTLLAIPPIVINADLGLRSVPAPLLEAARGLGMTAEQISRRVRWPLAAPVVLAGIRTAAVEVIASATLAAFIGGGGLGEYIIDGLANQDYAELLTGGVAVAALAILTELALGALTRRLTAKGQP